jgi:hypothetical protein
VNEIENVMSARDRRLPITITTTISKIAHAL